MLLYKFEYFFLPNYCSFWSLFSKFLYLVSYNLTFSLPLFVLYNAGSGDQVHRWRAPPRGRRTLKPQDRMHQFGLVSWRSDALRWIHRQPHPRLAGVHRKLINAAFQFWWFPVLCDVRGILATSASFPFHAVLVRGLDDRDGFYQKPKMVHS